MEKTSKDWCKHFDINQRDIRDPDGWDRANFDYSFNEEIISEKDFIQRLRASTVLMSNNIVNLMNREED